MRHLATTLCTALVVALGLAAGASQALAQCTPPDAPEFVMAETSGVVYREDGTPTVPTRLLLDEDDPALGKAAAWSLEPLAAPELAQLPAGEETKATLTYGVHRQAALKQGDACSHTVALPQPELALREEALAEAEFGEEVVEALPEATAAHALRVGNPGMGPAVDLQLSWPLPEGERFVSAESFLLECEYQPGPHAVSCSLGSLSPGTWLSIFVYTSGSEGGAEAVEEAAETPSAFALHANYPNPFNPQTQIRYDVAEQAHVRLRVYDVQGRLVETLVDAPQAAGSYAVTFEATDLPSGVYLYDLQVGDFRQVKKMILMK